MPEYPKLVIVPLNPKTFAASWGKFIPRPEMPWGPWRLTSEPKEIFKSEIITVLECFADEAIEDKQGFAAERTIWFNPCSRHFFVGIAPDKSVGWWYNLGEQRYDLENKRYYETSIRIEGMNLVIKGFGSNIEPDTEIYINILTGAVSKQNA